MTAPASKLREWLMGNNESTLPGLNNSITDIVTRSMEIIAV